jgi:hypothetical protein
VGEAARVQAPGDVGHLGRDAVPPGLTFQSGVVAAGEPGEIDGAGDLLGDQRTAHEAPAFALQAEGHDAGGGDAPLGEAQQVLPFELHARFGEQPLERLLAEAVVALDVVAASIDVDAYRARRRILGDDFAFEGEYGVEVGEARGRGSIRPGQDTPQAHAFSFGANFRR